MEEMEELKLQLLGTVEYEEECNDEKCKEYKCAEEYYGIEPEKVGFKYSEDNIPYYDPEKNEHDYVPSSDCDGVDTCWRNYIMDVGKLVIVLQFYDRNVIVMNEVVGIRFGLTIYLLKKSSPSP